MHMLLKRYRIVKNIRYTRMKLRNNSFMCENCSFYGSCSSNSYDMDRCMKANFNSLLFVKEYKYSYIIC